MIIFDLDGTLWDSGQSVGESWNIVLEQEPDLDLRVTSEDLHRNMGKTMNEIADDLFGMLPPKRRYELARKCEVFENEYITEHGGELYPDVRETLESLRAAGVRMAVVSNCQEGYIKAFLDSMHMHELFEDYEEWGRTGFLKADNIRLVMERNNAGRSIYVGDIQKDSDAAHAAGIPCIWAKYGFGRIEDAAAELSDFRELPAILAELGYI